MDVRRFVSFVIVCLRHLHRGSMTFFPLESKFWVKWKWSMSLGFSFFLQLYICAPLLFFLFLSFCCSDWPSTGLASSRKNSQKASSRWAIFGMEWPRAIASNFALSFSLIFEHFRACFRLHWADHSDLGTIGKSFPPTNAEYRLCQFWSKVMTSEVEQRPRRVTAGYGRYGSQWVKFSARQQSLLPYNWVLSCYTFILRLYFKTNLFL